MVIHVRTYIFDRQPSFFIFSREWGFELSGGVSGVIVVCLELREFHVQSSNHFFLPGHSLKNPLLWLCVRIHPEGKYFPLPSSRYSIFQP